MPHDATVGLSRSRTFLPQLEALRGVAVLLVFAFHFEGRMRAGIPAPVEVPLWMGLMRAGHAGVDLFFVLSAFLLTLPFLDERPQPARVFYARRALRILPLYYAVIACAALAAGDGLAGVRRALPYLVFLNTFSGTAAPMPPWSDVWWTLATEVQFYALLPVLGLARRSWVWRGVGLGVLVAWTLVYVGMVAGWYRLETIAGSFKLVHSIVGRGPLFLWGMAAAWVHHRHGDAVGAWLAQRRWLDAGGADVVLVVVLAGLAVFLGGMPSTLHVREATVRQPWHITAGALWTALVLVAVWMPLRSGDLAVGRLVARVLGRLGVLSYSIYLLHLPVIDVVLVNLRAATRHWTWAEPIGPLLYGWQPASVVLAAVIALACVGVSTLTFRFIERPFLVRKARFDVTA